MPANFTRRFEELCLQADHIEQTKRHERGEYIITGEYIDHDQLMSWLPKVRQLFVMVCGDGSHYAERLRESEKISIGTTNYDVLKRVRNVLRAAKDDFEGGYLNSFRNLVQADVYANELDQATELLKSGYVLAAAVIAGVVLETTLRQMCSDQKIEHGKLDRMNAELVRVGAYNKLVQKQITAWADIRNSAAHGKPEEFSGADVEAMIRDVERFVAERLS